MNRVTTRKTGHYLSSRKGAQKSGIIHLESHASHPAKESHTYPRLMLWATAGGLSILAMLVVGCVPGSKQMAHKYQWPNRKAATYGASRPGPSTGFVRPGSQGYPNANTGHHNQEPVLSHTGAEFDRPATSGGSNSNWEDQKVRVAALDLARSIPSTKKIKVCYDAKHDEWWVTLYDRQGAMFDVKQFVWERESEKLEPFLVLQRISQTKLEDHVKREEKGRACEVFDPPHGTM